MEILLLVLSAIALLGVGFTVGRDFTKWECGKMLVWLEQDGFLKLPFEDIYDEKDS